VERGAVVVPVRWQEGLRCVFLTSSARSRLRVSGVNPCGRGDGDLMRRRFRVGCGCFFLGGRRRGRGVPGRVLLRSFRRTAGSKQPILCYILYVEQWRFRCNMSSGHRERGFFDPRTTWTEAYDVSGFNNSSTCSHSDDSGGAAAPRSTTDSTE
jgi:hypothetical protein